MSDFAKTLKDFEFADYDIELILAEKEVDVVQTIIEGIIKTEGGYVNNSSDKGGPTKYGITQATLSKHLGRKASIDDVKNLSKEIASDIYREQYVAPFNFVKDQHLYVLLIDSGVNHGISNAYKFLQKALGVKVDGSIGTGTRSALQEANSKELYYRTVAVRNVFYGAIVNKNRSQAEFIEGWLNRMTQFIVGGP